MLTRILLLSLTASMLGCSHFEPTPNPWTERERVSEQATQPVEYPELEEDLSNLDDVLEAAAGNYEIAQANAEALERQSRAYNRALESGEAEHEIAEQMKRLYEQERRARITDGVKVGIGILLGIAIRR